MNNLIFILLIFQLGWLNVRGWVVSDEAYEDNEVISFDDDSTHKNEDRNEQRQEAIDYNIERPPTDKELEEKSRLLDLEENYIEPNIKHNLKLYDEYNPRKKKKRNAQDLNADEYTLRYKIVPVTEPDYDYDKFKAEYDHDVAELKKNQAKVNDSDFTSPPTSECNYEAFLNFGPITMYCLIGDLCEGPTLEIRREAKEKILGLLRIWAVFFGLFFFVGWAHFGYCNWICPSRHCFPEDGYEEIKQKLVMDPPGTLTRKIVPKKNDDSKTIIEKEYYEPNESEYYLYNSLWRDIYRE